MTAPDEPRTGGRTWAHTEALAEMYRIIRDALLSGDHPPFGCCAVPHWQATQESPGADARDRISALVAMIGEFSGLIDGWCEHVDAAAAPVSPKNAPPESKSPAAVARLVSDVAEWFDRSACVLIVGAAEMKYLAAELAGEKAAAPEH
ncbi:MAG TPA: hypothetical protein VFS43_21235 [Polyangiaceae bacterium]|nr:hypothetical protein [Polyangiaceae bacterium]